MRRAASSLTDMKNSKLDYPTAKKLRKLLSKIDIETNHTTKEGDDETPRTSKNNENENISGFLVKPEFVTMLNCRKIRVESLTKPPVGKTIDGICLPKFPPIDTLQGLIGNCSTPFEKQLTTTDLAPSEGRLLLCKRAVETFLKPILKPGVENIMKKNIDAMVYDEKGREYPMSFRFWTKVYVLTVEWNKFALENELKAHEDWVTVWMFRNNQTDGLCFAIISRRFPTMDSIGKAYRKGSEKCCQERKGKEKKIVGNRVINFGSVSRTSRL